MKKNLKVILFFITAMLILPAGIYYSNENNFFSKYDSKNYKDLFVDIDRDEVNIYVREKDINYIGYNFIHDEKKLNRRKNASNYNVWKLNGASYYERNKYGSFKEKLELVTTGEWELAIREKGANDFFGGSAHGDEITSSISIYVDGSEVDLDEISSHEASQLDIKVKSELYRDNTFVDDIQLAGYHEKEYSFDKDGLILSQEVEFTKSLTIDRAYLGMLPMARNDGKKKVTDTYTIDDDKKEYDVSFVKKELNDLTDGKKLTIFSKDSGVKATMEIIDKKSKITPQVLVWNDKKYNKMYFIYATDDYQTEIGENWAQVTKYEISVN